MGKDFIEYQKEKSGYSACELCYRFTDYARNYIKYDDQNTNSKIRDAVIVDFINYLGSFGDFDYALTVDGLYTEQRYYLESAPQVLLTIAANYSAYYIFDEKASKSVLRTRRLTNLKEIFDELNAADELLSFINYIAKVNEYDRVFTMKDLHKKYLGQKHNIDMKRLKEFLELSMNYDEKIFMGLSECKTANDLVSKIYENKGYSLGDESIPNFIKEQIDRELYALSYAYAKFDHGVEIKLDNEIIKEKIKEMSKR